MSVVRRNIVATFLGNAWVVLLTFLSVPLIVYFLGIEAYGLVGFFTTLMALLTVLDFGLSATLTREAAHLAPYPERVTELRNLARTLELAYWATGLAIGLSVFALAPLIATYWLTPAHLSQEVTRDVIELMALVLALRWPFPLYSGGLMGLERQVLANALRGGLETFRIGGSVLVLWLVTPSIKVFFIWQAISVFLATATLAILFWRVLPGTELGARFDPAQLRRVWRYAAGMMGISIASILLTQMDKVVLSKLLTLEQFGYYALASAAASILYQLVSPVYSAVFPRFVSLASNKANENNLDLPGLYHRTSQLVSVLVFPAALLAMFFSHQLLLLWTQNPATADQASLVFSVLVAGNALHCLVHPPYALQLAHGWTGLALKINLVSVLVMAPLLVVGAGYFGSVGAAFAWTMLTAGYVIVGVPLMHRRLLPGELSDWYLRDTLPALGAALLVVVLAAQFKFSEVSQPVWGVVLCLGSIYLLMLMAAAMALKSIRQWLCLRLITIFHRP